MRHERKAVVRIFSVLLAVMVAIGFTVTMTEEASAAAKTPAKVKIVSAKSDHKNGGVIVKWKKVKNAKYYEIHYDTKKNGKYENYTTYDRRYTSGTVYVGPLKPGKKYYFKVKAVNGSKDGKYSAVKSAKAVTSVPYMSDDYGIELKTENSVEINFAAYNFNDNYSCGVEVHRATSKNGKYKKIKTIKRGKNGVKSPYVDNNLSSGDYYYKIRAYHKVGKKNVYSKFTKVHSITVPKKITITADNWNQYFEIAEDIDVDKDAFGAVTGIDYNQILTLKDKYKVQETVWDGEKKHAVTDIAFEMAYTTDERNISIDKATGKITIGSVIPETIDEYGDKYNSPKDETVIGTLTVGYYDDGDVRLREQLHYQYSYLNDTSMRVGRDFKMLRIQGTLYLTKW